MSNVLKTSVGDNESMLKLIARLARISWDERVPSDVHSELVDLAVKLRDAYDDQRSCGWSWERIARPDSWDVYWRGRLVSRVSRSEHKYVIERAGALPEHPKFRCAREVESYLRRTFLACDAASDGLSSAPE